MKPINLKEEMAKGLLNAGHFVEVAKDFYNRLEVSQEDLVGRLEKLFFCTREFYCVEGTVIQVLHGHLAGTTQYYIQDINA